MNLDPGPTPLPEGIEMCEHEIYHQTNGHGDRITHCRKCCSWAMYAAQNPAPGFPVLGPYLVKRDSDA